MPRPAFPAGRLASAARALCGRFLPSLRRLLLPRVRADRPGRECAWRRISRRSRHVRTGGTAAILPGLVVLALAAMALAPVPAQAQPLSDDNTLRSLRVTWGSDTYSMSPAFDRFRNDYVVVVPAGRTEVIVTPTKNHHGATGPHVTPGDNDGTGSYTVDLSPGSNIVHISLSAELGHFRRYSLNIYRGGSLPTATLPSGALLSSLRLTAGAEVVELPGEEVEGEDCGLRDLLPDGRAEKGLAAGAVRDGAVRCAGRDAIPHPEAGGRVRRGMSRCVKAAMK